MKKTIIISAIVAILNCSCLTTKTNVGSYAQQTGKEQTYSKNKQIWVLWGIIPVGRTHAATPPDGSCQVITKFTLLDDLVSILTGGFIVMETIKVKVKEQPKTIAGKQ